MFLNASYLRALAHRCVRLAHDCPDRKISHELDAIGAELMEKAAEITAGIAAASAASSAADTAGIPDPLLALLRRYEAELAAFNSTTAMNRAGKPDWDKVAEETWLRTQDAIVEQQPSATTAAGALLALDHVLKNEELFGERTEYAGQQMLWLLIKAARDYIAVNDRSR